MLQFALHDAQYLPILQLRPAPTASSEILREPLSLSRQPQSFGGRFAGALVGAEPQIPRADPMPWFDLGRTCPFPADVLTLDGRGRAQGPDES